MCKSNLNSYPLTHRSLYINNNNKDPTIKMLQMRSGQNERAHTLISQFETPARIICETINPAPLLRMFFGGRHYSNDFRSLGNAMPRLALLTPCWEDEAQRRRKTPFVLYNCMNDEYVLFLVRDDFLCVRPTAPESFKSKTLRRLCFGWTSFIWNQ